jgi:hypothetical protein
VCFLKWPVTYNIVSGEEIVQGSNTRVTTVSQYNLE